MAGSATSCSDWARPTRPASHAGLPTPSSPPSPARSPPPEPRDRRWPGHTHRLDPELAAVLPRASTPHHRELRTLPIGIKALGSNPRRSRKEGTGESDIPLTFGGVTFVLGQRLVSDEDGIVILPAGEVFFEGMTAHQLLLRQRALAVLHPLHEVRGWRRPDRCGAGEA
ncbi:hypothetical protein AB0D24_27575 [Streptomyces javensis]|uniref:RraA family protein n=1 Tax=Streptomyces javensis TaxID=114698 RepID=UPI0033F5B44D